MAREIVFGVEIRLLHLFYKYFIIRKMIPLDMPDDLLTEAVIQGEFFHQSRLLGMNCVLEHVTPAGRLDVAVFSSDWSVLLAIVEIKNKRLYRSPQIERYKKIGVPVFGLNNLTRCARLAAQIQRDCVSGVLRSEVEKLQIFRRKRGRRKFDASQLDEGIIYRN